MLKQNFLTTQRSGKGRLSTESSVSNWEQ